MNTRNFIIVHHTASYATGTPQFDAVDRYHKSKGWGSIGYQYFIEYDGTIKKGRDESAVGAHTSQWLMNYRSIGICLAGDFDVQTPSKAQLNSLRELLTDVQLRNGIRDGRIRLHRDFAHYKSCPGQKFTRQLLDGIIFPRRMKTKITVVPRPDLAPTHE